jgi:hypothetical protein
MICKKERNHVKNKENTFFPTTKQIPTPSSLRRQGSHKVNFVIFDKKCRGD